MWVSICQEQNRYSHSSILQLTISGFSLCHPLLFIFIFFFFLPLFLFLFFLSLEIQVHCGTNVGEHFVKFQVTPHVRVTGLCAGNSPRTGEFPAQRASNLKIHKGLASVCSTQRDCSKLLSTIDWLIDRLIDLHYPFQKYRSSVGHNTNLQHNIKWISNIEIFPRESSPPGTDISIPHYVHNLSSVNLFTDNGTHVVLHDLSDDLRRDLDLHMEEQCGSPCPGDCVVSTKFGM